MNKNDKMVAMACVWEAKKALESLERLAKPPKKIQERVERIIDQIRLLEPEFE